jgi:hypothetical protein
MVIIDGNDSLSWLSSLLSLTLNGQSFSWMIFMQSLPPSIPVDLSWKLLTFCILPSFNTHPFFPTERDNDCLDSVRWSWPRRGRKGHLSRDSGWNNIEGIRLILQVSLWRQKKKLCLISSYLCHCLLYLKMDTRENSSHESTSSKDDEGGIRLWSSMRSECREALISPFVFNSTHFPWWQFLQMFCLQVRGERMVRLLRDCCTGKKAIKEQMCSTQFLMRSGQQKSCLISPGLQNQRWIDRQQEERERKWMFERHEKRDKTHAILDS